MIKQSKHSKKRLEIDIRGKLMGGEGRVLS